MSNPELSQQPNPNIGPVRQNIDGEPPIAGFLAEIREGISIIDPVLVTDLYERYEYVIGATLFKRNLEEVEATEQQAINIANAVASAKQVAPDNEGFHRYIEDIWTFIVKRSVAAQAEAFDRTKPIPE